jgi:nucleoside-diphosphate-sugar epimerase
VRPVSHVSNVSPVIPPGAAPCLVTGAGGFVGAALLARLRTDAIACRGVRRARAGEPAEAGAALPDGCVAGPELGADADWSTVLAGCRTVVHAAARVHVMHDTSADPLAEFGRVNVQGSLALARQAAAAGVRRLVFVSSVKVHGESTRRGHPLRACDPLAPVDPYGVSKAQAEDGLRAVARETGLELVVVRPPLVYGPGVGGNFLSMMRWLRRGVPMPFGAVDNRRSLVALDTLVDLLVTCLHHPRAAGQGFLVSDDEDLSTAGLLRRLGAALGRPARLLPVPVGVLRGVAAAVGREAVVARLVGDLQVDVAPTRSVLGWAPALTVDEGLRQAARWFLDPRRQAGP